jgi:diguanylate cyclase (GGDEF)-like protein
MRLKYHDFKKGVLYFTVMSIISVVLILIIFLLQLRTVQTSVSETLKTDLNAFSINIDNQVGFVASDILLMEDIITNRNSLILSGDSLDFDSQLSKEEMENDLIDWITIHSVYDQIRIIGLDGMEVLRINNNDGNPTVVPDEDLQDKSGRYYFENAINLDDDVLYLSRIDLNIENGEIEYINGVPKQMLRIGSTILNENNEKIGMMIVNYFAENLFHDSEANISTYTSFEVINEQGYYLHHPDESMEYGFMFDDKQDLTFDRVHNYDISSIVRSSSDIVQEQINVSTFTYYVINNNKMENAITESVGRRIEVYSDNGDLYIFGVVQFNETDVFVNLRNTYIVLTIVIVMLVLVFSRLMDEIQFGRQQRLMILEYSSNHDTLTGLPNRKSIFSTLEYLTSRQEKFTLLFLDLDGFKNVNDKYGHSVGDMLLIEVSKRLKDVIRQTDYVARLGGDEFLVVLNNVNDDVVAKKIAKKIANRINEPINCEEKLCNVGVSIGVSVQKGNKTVEDVINEADSNMYIDKDIRKRDK